MTDRSFEAPDSATFHPDFYSYSCIFLASPIVGLDHYEIFHIVKQNFIM